MSDVFPIQRDKRRQIGVRQVLLHAFITALAVAIAFSLPMIMDCKADPITAVVSSVHAVLCNKGAMLVWAGLIGLAVLIGFATAFLGLAVLLPLLGHATWHAYREVVGPADHRS